MSRRHKWDPECAAPTGLVRPVRMDPSGERGPTLGQTQGPNWRRTTHGFYVPASVDPGIPEQRILEQSMRLPEGGAVTGWAGCRLHGANFFDGLLTDGTTEMPVPLCVGAAGQIRHRPGSLVSRDRLQPSEVVLRYGIACARRLRALFDAARAAPDLRESVVAVDMMAAAKLVSIRQMLAYVIEHGGWEGVEQLRAALGLADEHSRSPNETRMRLIWQVDAGLPRPLVNKAIFDRDGRLLGIADLLDPVAGVVGEFDGADHRAARRHSSDVAREDGFRRKGLEVFRVTGPDLPDVPKVTARMHAARGRALWLDPAETAWTVEPPPWWDWWEPGLELDELFAYRQMIDDLERQPVSLPADL